MPCETVPSADGRSYTIVCSRGSFDPRKPREMCQVCGTRPVEVECDYPDTSHDSGTCDRRLCRHRACTATRWKNNKPLDYCRAHVDAKEPAHVSD